VVSECPRNFLDIVIIPGLVPDHARSGNDSPRTLDRVSPQKLGPGRILERVLPTALRPLSTVGPYALPVPDFVPGSRSGTSPDRVAELSTCTTGVPGS